MPDKNLATLKFSLGLEEVERIFVHYLAPWLESGLGHNVDYPSLKTLEQYLQTYMDKSVELRY